jgi:HPt (histidine-containing phosphotransfer) domain-containing protein
MNILDHNLLDDYCLSLGTTIVAEMLAIYHQQVGHYLKDIEQAIDQDEQTWHQACHTMKGAAGSIGLKELNQKLAQHEKNCQDKGGAYKEIAALNQESLTAFESWLSEK